VGDVSGHAHGHAALILGDVDEQLSGAALEVAAEDVTGEQVASIEGGPTTGSDTLSRGGTRQHDDLGCWGRDSRQRHRDQQGKQQQRHGHPPDPSC
jgi:hypothetical protein